MKVNTSFTWTYPDQHGQDVEVEFISQDEVEQREV